MTVQGLQKQIVEMLKAGGCDTPAFDAVCLLEDIGGIGRGNVPSSYDETLPDEKVTAVREAAQKRAQGMPLQYLLGTWDFLSLTLEVGEGVLIPRPDTELLCMVAAEELAKRKKRTVWDLCAGSGCVGLGIASLCKEVTVTEVELSDDAFAYLERNLCRYPQYAVKAVRADVLKDADRFASPVDAIVSNPPYIPSGDLSGLQREVQFEPKMALDGAKDGYLFYRAIAERWLPKLADDGFVAVEVGFDQAQAVADIFKNVGLLNISIYQDAAGIDRVVMAKR